MIKNKTLSAATEESVGHAKEFLQSSLKSIEKIAKLQLDSSKKILSETTDAIKEISSAKNPQDFFTRLNQLASKSVESNIANCRDLYKILSEVQANVGKLIENNIHNTQNHVAHAVEDFAKFKPENASASEAFKGWINSSNQAIATMQKVASQVTEFTKQNIKAASSTKKTAAKK